MYKSSGGICHLVKLDSFLDSGHSWPFQRGLLASNAAEAGQAYTHRLTLS